MITVINNIDGSALGDNRIANQQTRIPADAVENNQESMASKTSCGNKVGRITLLV